LFVKIDLNGCEVNIIDLMDKQLVWVQGGSRSGKTQYLVEWAAARLADRPADAEDRLLILTSNDDSK
jgi:hypothetical protein